MLLGYSDRDIIQALQSGKDDKVLAYLYKHVLPKVRHYIMSNKGNDEEAKDIFQDAVIIFYKKVKMHDFEGEMNVTAYICYVAKNLWINRVKKMNRTSEMPDYDNESTIADEKDFLQEMIKDEKSVVISKLLNAIGEECKKLLRLSTYEGLSMKEICEKMGYSNENVAKTYNYRCKQKLIQLVQKNKTVIDLLRYES